MGGVGRVYFRFGSEKVIVLPAGAVRARADRPDWGLPRPKLTGPTAGHLPLDDTRWVPTDPVFRGGPAGYAPVAKGIAKIACHKSSIGNTLRVCDDH
jgi:hypothetical protein